MCGIIGVSSPDNIDPSEIRILLMLAQDRGRDSTGFATPDMMSKKAESADEFIRRQIPDNTNLLIGHTRAKTTGAINNRNAHPFSNGKLVGTHNGYISNWWNLKKEEDLSHMKVDSEVIWHLINKYGLKESIPKLQGSFALAWIDENDQLNLYRHAKPIWTGVKNGAYYYGSKKLYLNAIDCEQLTELDEHTHLIVSDGEIKESNDLSHIKPKERTYSTEYYGYTGHTSGYQYKNTNIRNKYPPSHAPYWSRYVHSAEGFVYYYWLNTSQTVLNVEPVYKGLEYGIKDCYNLHNSEDIQDLKNHYPEVVKEPYVKQSLKHLNYF